MQLILNLKNSGIRDEKIAKSAMPENGCEALKLILDGAFLGIEMKQVMCANVILLVNREQTGFFIAKHRALYDGEKAGLLPMSLMQKVLNVRTDATTRIERLGDVCHADSFLFETMG